MTKTTRRRALALIGSTALAGCSTAPAFDTLNERDPFEGGIGGTGIVGVLNGFGSLLVNGLRVDIAGDTRYRTAFGRTGLDALAPGLPLTIQAQRSRGRFVARSVHIDYALVGIVHRGTGGLAVNGVPVRVESGAAGRLVLGSRVAIGGVWTRNGVSASRIEPAPNAPDLIAGTVGRRTQSGFAIGPADIVSSGVRPIAGQYAVALGRAEGTTFEATSVDIGRFDGSVALRQLSVEGYLEPVSSAPGFRIAGLGHSFARDVRLSGIGTRRAVYFGRYDGSFGASRGYVVPDNFTARAVSLRTGIATGPADTGIVLSQ